MSMKLRTSDRRVGWRAALLFVGCLALVPRALALEPWVDGRSDGWVSTHVQPVTAVAGCSDGSAFVAAGGGGRPWIVRFDEDGVASWEARLDDWEEVVALLPNDDGSVVIFANRQQPKNDFLVARLSAAGAVEWARTVSRSGSWVLRIGERVTRRAGGGYLVMAETTPLGSGGGFSAVAVELSSFGELASAWELDWTANEDLHAGVAVERDGEILAAIGGSAHTDEAPVLVQFRRDGEVTWARQLDGGGGTFAGLASLPDGRINAVGITKGTNGRELLAARFSSSGELELAWAYEEPSVSRRYYSLASAIEREDGAIYVSLNEIGLYKRPRLVRVDSMLRAAGIVQLVDSIDAGKPGPAPLALFPTLEPLVGTAIDDYREWDLVRTMRLSRAGSVDTLCPLTEPVAAFKMAPRVVTTNPVSIQVESLVLDSVDHALTVTTPGSFSSDVCHDFDGDGIFDREDNCPETPNPGQANADSDQHGDACDLCPSLASPDNSDPDSDSVGTPCDNCPQTSNADQIDSDADGAGDACEPYGPALLFETVRGGSVKPWWSGGPTTLEWNEGRGNSSYNLYRGSLSVLRAGGEITQEPGSHPDAGRHCALAEPRFVDDYDPSPGDAVYWLVSGVGDDGEAPLGLGTDTVRENAHPCPAPSSQ